MSLKYSIRTVLIYETAETRNIHVMLHFLDGFNYATVADWFLHTHVFMLLR